MSSSVFPSLVGMTMDRDRDSNWSTIVQSAVSGKETRVGLRNYPRWTWNINFDILRSDVTNAELQSLAGFFNLRRGSFDSFLWTDNDDYSVTAQTIGVGDGSTLTFQLLRSMGGFSEAIQAPNTVSAVYLNGVAANPVSYSVSSWGATNPGVITFVSAPAGGTTITADLTYYWPVRFVDDKMTFARFMSQMYDAKGVGLIQIL